MEKIEIAGSIPSTCKNELVLLLRSTSVRMTPSHRQDVFSKRCCKCCLRLNLLILPHAVLSWDLSTMFLLLSLVSPRMLFPWLFFSPYWWRWRQGRPPPQRCVSVSHTDHVSSAFLLTSLHLQSCQSTSSLAGFGICKSTPQSRSQGRADSAGADNRFLHKPVFRRPAWMHHGQGEPFHNKVSVFK